MNWKKFIAGLVIALAGSWFYSTANAAMINSVDAKPTSYWYEGNPTKDTALLFAREVETIIEAWGFENTSAAAGDIITFPTNGLTIDNVNNNALEINENSDELILTFGSNTITMSSGDVTLFEFGTVVVGFDQFKVNATTYTFPTADGTNGQVLKTDGSATLSWAANAGGISDLDTAYDGGNTIDVDGDAVTLTVSTTDNNAALILVQEDVSQSAGSDPNALEITMTVLSDGDAINITSQDTANDVVGANWSVDGLGALIAVSADLTGAAGLVLSNDAAITNAVDSALKIAEGGESLILTFGSNTITLSSDDLVDQLAFGAVDNLTGIDDIAFDATTTSGITKASSAGSADFTVAMSGSVDASLILSSAGTTGDALQIVTTAGGIDITGGGAAGGEDVDIDSVLASLNLNADEDVAESITINASTGGIDITADGASGKNLDMVCTNGSTNISGGEADAAAVTIAAAAGGIDITSAGAGLDTDITATGGKVIITGNENAAGAITLTTAGAGNTGETIVVLNDQGTGAASIGISSTAGGITLAVPTAKAVLMTATSGSNTTIGNVAGDLTMAGDNVDITVTAATNDVFQIVSSASSQVLCDVDLGATDAITWGDNSNAGATTVVGATFTATGGIGGTSGAGGASTIQGGTGGIAIASTSVGGAGGALNLSGGIGGAGLTDTAGGAGGALTAAGGVGGVAHGTGNAASGGNASLTGGAGGAGVSGGGNPGTAGTVAVTAGAGGAGTTADSGAAGGTAGLVGGVGGIGAAAKVGGAGGAVSVTGGLGGASLTGTSGAGGAVNIDGGAGVTGGAVSIDAGAGSTTDGSITIGATDALVVNIGNATSTTSMTGNITFADDLYINKGSDAASGGELDLSTGTFFDVTGTTNITSIAAADSIAGRIIVLQFDGVLTFTDGNNLKIAGNFVTTADDTITLVCDGTNWWEMCRSVN